MVVKELREACAWVAQRARHVGINTDAISPYAASLEPAPTAHGPLAIGGATAEWNAALWLTLDAINFGSGWFPELRKRTAPTGYGTIAAGVRYRFETEGPWSAAELATIDAAEIAIWLDQEPDHELMGLFACCLQDLGRHLPGSFTELVDVAGNSAVALVETLARWDCFADASTYQGRAVPFLKRAQLAAADLHRSGVARFADLDRLTMFADNLVPHVLRLDGILWFEPDLVDRIEHEQLIEHGSPEEVEIRACALHAVELLVAASPSPTTSAALDQLLWERGQGATYKAVPRHRCRTTAY